eukprot:scaffold170789_cov17-Prasinocladus_malaysianus.AAC.1
MDASTNEDIARFSFYCKCASFGILRAISSIIKSSPRGFRHRWPAGSNVDEEKRAKQCVQLLADLGPTFVKIGQALSIRVDLLSPAYIAQFRTLQDKLLRFPGVDAYCHYISARVGYEAKKTVVAMGYDRRRMAAH